MEGYSFPDGLIQAIQDGLATATWKTVVVAFLVILCIATRIITGLQSSHGVKDAGETRPVKMAPYWFPWLGHGLSFAWDHASCIKKARRSMDEPVFSITLGGGKHNVVVSPSMAKSIYAFRGTSSSPLVNHIMERVFSDSGAVRAMGNTDVNMLHQNALNPLLREPFATEASVASVRRIQRETPNLVTFCRSVVDQVPWERPSEITMEDGDHNVCEANLYSLIRNFAAYNTTVGFMGHAIFEAFPNILDDLWILDAQFTTLSKGARRWVPSPGISAAFAARDRLLKACAAYHEAFIAWDNDKDPGFDWRDLDDVAEPVKQRIRGLHKMGMSSTASAPAHLSLLWAMNGNTAGVVFWNLIRVYAEPTLLNDIRKEIAPYVKAFRPSREETGFPFEERPQVHIDPQGVFESCPLLKASFYECLRLDTAGLSFRELSADLTLTESKEDAAIDGLERPRVYKLPKGESVAIPHGVLQNDTRYFSNPSQYDPLRFITTDPNTGSMRADMHTIRPFGGGASGCRGRIIAERENLAVVAAIVSLWDIEPTSGKQLKVPGHKSSTGTYLPKKDMRVKMRLRV